MKKWMLISVLITICIFGCKKDDEETNPQVPDYTIETGAPSGISNSAAKFIGTISNVNGNQVINFGHVWSTSQNPTVGLQTKTIFGSISSDTVYTSTLTNLVKGTTYFVRAYTTDNNGTYYGQESSFQTKNDFFKFVVSSNYIYQAPYISETGAWVLIYSMDGQLLNKKEIFNGNTYEFDWPAKVKSENYMVQLFSYRKHDESSSSADNYSLACYLDIVPDTWYLGSEPIEGPDQIGENIVHTGDVDLGQYYISDIRNKYARGYFISTNEISLKQYVNPDNIYIMFMNEAGAPYYKWIGNVGLNDSYSLSSSDFTQMTDYVDFIFPQSNSSMVYIESEDDLQTDFWEYYLVYFNSTDDQSSIRAYYPSDLFNGYYSYFTARTNNVWEVMLKRRGPIPGQFVSLPDNLDVGNSSVLDFSANINSESDIVRIFWDYIFDEGEEESYFSYHLHGSKITTSGYSAPDLPLEIIEINAPLLDLALLQYGGSSFDEYDNYNGFKDYITDRYVSPGSLSDNALYYYRKTIHAFSKDVKGKMDDLEEIKLLKSGPLGY